MGFKYNNNEHPSLITFCGLPGSDKTTSAKKLERETGAIRLNTDEWMAAIGADFFDGELHEKLQERLYKHGLELLERGQSIIVEDGHWSKAERNRHRADAKRLGATIVLHYFDLSFDELWHGL